MPIKTTKSTSKSTIELVQDPSGIHFRDSHAVLMKRHRTYEFVAPKLDGIMGANVLFAKQVTIQPSASSRETLMPKPIALKRFAAAGKSSRQTSNADSLRPFEETLNGSYLMKVATICSPWHRLGFGTAQALKGIHKGCAPVVIRLWQLKQNQR